MREKPKRRDTDAITCLTSLHANRQYKAGTLNTHTVSEQQPSITATPQEDSNQHGVRVSLYLRHKNKAVNSWPTVTEVSRRARAGRR